MTNIDRAVAFISEIGVVRAVSAPVFSAPWGYVSDSEFMNVGLNIDVELSPFDLLAALKRIERLIAPDESHRTADGEYADRTIDLDLIAYGTEVADAPELTLPHPRMAEREFVLRPMVEIMPHWRHPKNGLTPSEMLEKIQ